MKLTHRILAALLLALAAAAPARAESISLLCGGADRFDMGTVHTTMLETNGDHPVIVYSHVKITGDVFSGDITLDGKKTSVVINRKTGQAQVTHPGVPTPERRTCTPYAPAAPAPTNKF